MSDTLSKEQFKKKMEKLTVPEGFTFSIEEDLFGWGKDRWLVGVLKNETMEMRFSQTGCGTTNYVAKDGKTYTFDRLGVEASFYWYADWGEKKSLNAIVKEQIKRVSQQMAADETAIQVPGLPFSVQPNRLAALKKQLKDRGSISFMPSGFGRGYIVKVRSGSRWDKRASKELETFLGHQPLFIETFDAD